MHLHELQTLNSLPGFHRATSGTLVMPKPLPTIIDDLRAVRGALKSTDHAAAVNRAVQLLTTIQSFLDGEAWSSETVESIADALRNEGIAVRDPT